MRRRTVSLSLLLLLVGMLCMPACASTGNPREQVRPPVASVSPDMDFTRISRLGILPLFPSGNGVEEAAFAEALISSITGEIQLRQSQWTIVNYRDMLNCINSGGLATGYKNLQADYNTFGGPGGQMVLTEPSKEFMHGLTETCGVEGVLLGSYTLTTYEVEGQILKFLTTVRERCEVRVSLFFAPDERNWWTATVERWGDKDAVILEIAQSLGANLGKGTLRQL